ncbi:ABC transporter ATP-binding protein [Pelagibius sp.]|uniref:ABC transporter ATP-binding protein n=1 Tax=Pelagibius sp. TaxID=1931238 RepID=UPI003BB12D39
MELRLEGISHRYDALTVLEDISLTVEEGETLALIGPSGCGKSTLLGILGGLLQPSAGRVVAEGAVPASCLNPLTYVFQDFALLPWRSVADNVSLALEHHQLSANERRERIAEVLQRTGLSDFAAAFPGQLSGGMRQRVGIARALAVMPAVLLMDEPLSALDAQTRDLLMEDFLDLWVRERTTAVYVTHNLNEALRLADKVAVLSRRPGRLREIVPLTIPQSERGSSAALAELARLHDHLWGLIKDEARTAEREVADV